MLLLLTHFSGGETEAPRITARMRQAQIWNQAAWRWSLCSQYNTVHLAAWLLAAQLWAPLGGCLSPSQRWTIHLWDCKTELYMLTALGETMVLANISPETIYLRWSRLTKCFVSCTVLYKCELGWQLWSTFCLIKYNKKIIMPSAAGYFCFNQSALCFLCSWPLSALLLTKLI